ncbi:MAG: flagellar assembly protein FliH [Myxococcaceae bacterium]
MSPYRLQTLLEIRERAEEAAKQAFSLATQEVVKAQAELKRLQDDLERRKAERKAKVAAFVQELIAKGGGVGELSQMNRFELRLRDEEAEVALHIERQKATVKNAERVREKKRAEMAEAAKELKAIEKHKEKWSKEVRRERDMREDLAGEEIGSALHLARARRSGSS